MRGLSALELVGLTDLVSGPDGEIEDDDPIVSAWRACADRGLATFIDDPDGCVAWNINDLGRLALRVHRAVTQGT